MNARSTFLRRLAALAALLAAPMLLGNDGCSPSQSTSSVGSLCGGLDGLACADGLYCDYAAASSPTGAGIGRCATQPDATACVLVYAPVCGLDGRTYSNDCFAAAAGVSVAHEGACDPVVGGCIALYDPVCGVDGVTYGNACEAAAANVTVDHVGACAGGACPEPAPLAPNVLCADGSIGGPACVCDAAGCAWQIRSCPPAAQLCGGFAGVLCPAGQFCDYDPSTNCGSGDQSGTCRDVPEACTLEYAPVCGCDAKTYGNACGAASAGVSVAHGGACKTDGSCSPTDCGPGPASPLPYECVLDASGVCSWQLACLPTPCAAPPPGCAYVGGDACHCGTLVCDPGVTPTP